MGLLGWQADNGVCQLSAGSALSDGGLLQTAYLAQMGPIAVAQQQIGGP